MGTREKFVHIFMREGFPAKKSLNEIRMRLTSLLAQRAKQALRVSPGVAEWHERQCRFPVRSQCSRHRRRLALGEVPAARHVFVGQPLVGPPHGLPYPDCAYRLTRPVEDFETRASAWTSEQKFVGFLTNLLLLVPFDNGNELPTGSQGIHCCRVDRRCRFVFLDLESRCKSQNLACKI